MKNIILPETIISGWYDSRKSSYRDLSVSPRRRVARFELELPVGDFGIPYINGTCPPFKKGYVVCAKPGDLRETCLPYQCYYLHLVVSEGELYRRLMELPPFIPMDSDAALTEMFTGNDVFENFGTDLHSAARLLEWIHLLTQQGRTESESFRSMERVCAYVQNNPDHDLSLNTLAEISGFSPSYFHSSFKKYAGKTIRDYVEEQRLKKAMRLLISTEKTLVEIAYDCGFSSQSYFNYVFKKKMNLSPRAYAKAYCDRYENY